MPDGTDDGWGDIAPGYSPVLVPGLSLEANGVVQVRAVSGGVNNVPWGPGFSADGNPGDIQSHIMPNYGKSNVVSPLNTLLGVFLSEAEPSGDEPPTLDFSTQASRDYLELSPTLKQVFAFGDGQTTAGQQQTVYVPAGATRLFLGIMDSYQHSSNWGSFKVTLADVPIPEPTSLLIWSLLGALALTIGRWRRRR